MEYNASTKKEAVMGVYRVFDAENPDGESFMGFSRNVEGTIKRLRFELTLNACSYKPLQQYFASCRDPKIELHEVYSPDGGTDNMDDTEIDAHLYALMLSSKTKLSGTVRFIQTPGALNI